MVLIGKYPQETPLAAEFGTNKKFSNIFQLMPRWLDETSLYCPLHTTEAIVSHLLSAGGCCTGVLLVLLLKGSPIKCDDRESAGGQGGLIYIY